MVKSAQFDNLHVKDTTMTENPRIQSATLSEHLPSGNREKPNPSIYDILYMFEDRFTHIEPLIQSFIPEDNRFERLRTQARELETRHYDFTKRPPLFGVLVGVKDIFHADGFITRAGTQVPPDVFAGNEAAIVTKLKQAGALVAGKTVTTEFAYFEPGPTRNPHNLKHTPGGSSSGSAAAVASGLVHVALGTQTVGSVIRPAAYCGIVGYKPTYGRIDSEGLIYFSRSADHVGLFAQDVDSLKKVASVVVDEWSDENLPEHKPVLGVPEGAYLQQSTALDEFEKHVTMLENAGYTVKGVPMFDDIQTIDDYHQDMIAAELAIEHNTWFVQHEDKYRQRTADLIRKGQSISNERRTEGQVHRTALREQIHQAMDDHEIDLWICPPAPDVAPEGISATGSPAMNMPWTHAGVPVVTVPAGTGKLGLPLGLQICGRYGEDEKLIHWSQDIESVY